MDPFFVPSFNRQLYGKLAILGKSIFAITLNLNIETNYLRILSRGQFENNTKRKLHIVGDDILGHLLKITEHNDLAGLLISKTICSGARIFLPSIVNDPAFPPIDSLAS